MMKRIDVDTEISEEQVFFVPKLQFGYPVEKLKDTSQGGVCCYDIETGQYS